MGSQVRGRGALVGVRGTLGGSQASQAEVGNAES